MSEHHALVKDMNDFITKLDNSLRVQGEHFLNFFVSSTMQ